MMDKFEKARSGIISFAYELYKRDCQSAAQLVLWGGAEYLKRIAAGYAERAKFQRLGRSN
jgi:hypothetical protein